MAAGSQAAAAAATAAAAKAKATTAAKPSAPAPAKTTTAGGYSGIPATKTTTTGGYSGIPATQTINLYGTPATNARTTTTGTTKTGTTTSPYNTTGPFNPQGGVGTGTYGPSGGGDTTTTTTTTAKTIVSRIPRLDSKGKVIGYDLVYSDGTTGFESNPAYGVEEEEVKGTTNINVLKALLLSAGLPSSLVDSSVPFLQDLIKDGIDAASAVEIYLNSKDFTTKDGKTVVSPFYTQYGFYNDKLGAGAKYSAKDLFNAVEGYKTTGTKYNLDPKFTAPDYIQNLLTNKWSVALFDQEANKARLAAINADPTYIDTLKKLNFINGSQDLTDFFMDSKIGVEKMQQNFNTVAFAQEAIRRANDASQIKFDKATAEKYGAQLTLQGMNEAEVSALASQGYQNIAQTLAPETKYSGIFERENAVSAGTIQAELEAEQFKGLESERRRRLAEMNIRSFQGSPGITTQSLSTGMYQA
jgi:hypothetical protein